MKRLFSPLTTAWTSVVTHKLRSFLTILGVVIGVAAVIALMSVGKGTESRILSNLSGLGTNLLYVQPGSTTQAGVRTGFGTASTLTLEDSQSVASEVSGITAVAPYTQSSMQVIAGSQNMMVRITGVTPDYQQVFNVGVAGGDFITQYQYDRNMKIALLGSTVASTLFGEDDPVGQTIRMGSNIFTVAGVLEAKGLDDGSTDEVILIPFRLSRV
jgi:putative ABC transport system permease protein